VTSVITSDWISACNPITGNARCAKTIIFIIFSQLSFTSKFEDSSLDYNLILTHGNANISPELLWAEVSSTTVTGRRCPYTLDNISCCHRSAYSDTIWPPSFFSMSPHTIWNSLPKTLRLADNYL